MPGFNSLHILRYLKGALSQARILAMYPWENTTTLVTAAAIKKASHTFVG